PTIPHSPSLHDALPISGGRDLDKLRAAAQLVDRGAAGVAHARTQAAGELLDHPHDAALVGDAPLDALGHQLVDVHVRVLEVAVRDRKSTRLNSSHVKIS